MLNLSEKAALNLGRLREKKPLIHGIINAVTINFTANALLAVGASPVMSHAASEVEETAEAADALVLNIGTLSEDRVPSMIRAARKYNRLGKPIVFDPVGAGATAYRTYTAKRLLQQVRMSVVRGNASELLALGRGKSRAKGVDAMHGVEEALETGKLLSDEFGAVFAVTGSADAVFGGGQTARVRNGHPLMTRITGTGCAAAAIVAAFAAIDPDFFAAAATALACFGLAGEIAARSASGPGSLAYSMLDALYLMTPEDLQAGCRIELV
jgi:hydroxyethylthiazole kinase